MNAAERAWSERWDQLGDELVASVIDQRLAEVDTHHEDQEHRAAARVALGDARNLEAATRAELWRHAQVGITRGYLRTRTTATR